METRPLGKTDMRVDVLGFGGADLGSGREGDEDAEAGLPESSAFLRKHFSREVRRIVEDRFRAGSWPERTRSPGRRGGS